MIGPFSSTELLIIFLLILIFLGPKATRELARDIGRAVREMNRALNEALNPREEEKK